MSAPLAFVDTETTGLDADRHEIWEVGLLRPDLVGANRERRWFLPVDLGRADPVALKIGRFYERHPQVQIPFDGSKLTYQRQFSHDFSRLTAGCHLVGAVISFDEERLRKLLRANGACPDWHYHLVDVEALAAGKLGWRPPWKSDELGLAVGVRPPSDEERHTALGDAKWARDIYDAVMGEL